MGSLLQDVLGLFSKKKYTQPIPYVPSKDDFFFFFSKTDSALNVMAYLPKVDQTLISAKQFADAIVAGTNTTYDYANADVGGKTNLTLTGSDTTVDTVSLVGGTGVTIASTGSDVDISVTAGTYVECTGTNSAYTIPLWNSDGTCSLIDSAIVFNGVNKYTLDSSRKLEISWLNMPLGPIFTSNGVGTAGQVLTNNAAGNLEWTTPDTGFMSSWSVGGEGGFGVTDGETVLFIGGTKITSVMDSGSESVTFNHDLTARVDTDTAISPAAGTFFDVIDSITQDTTGHTTAVNVKRVTLPAAGGGGGGTVTIVSSTTAGDALDVAITNETTTPALAFTWAGTAAQYINGLGNLITFPASSAGTVTSVASLTLGTSGTDLTSTVANGTTDAVITLNVPTASATNRGALSAADWITFNSKGNGTVTTVSSSFAGTAFTSTVTNASTTPAIAITANGASTDYVNGAGDFIALSTLPATDPAGADTEVQYNNSGAFGAGSFFTTNKSSKVDVTYELGLIGDGTNQGLLKLYCEAGTPHYVGLKGPNHSGGSSYTLQLPNTLPNVANQILESNAAGTLSWIATPSGAGGVTSVGLAMPAAFTISDSPVTSAGTITVTGAGTSAQYIDGTGALQTMPASDNYDYWTMSDGKGTTQQVDSTDEVTFTGGTDITCAISSPDTLTINHNLLGTAGTYTYPAEIITNSTGHITSITSGSAPTTYSKWVLTGDTGSQDIEDGNTALFEGGVALTTVASATDTLTINLDNTAVTPGTYQNPEIQIDQQGRITSATSKEVAYLTYVALWNNVKGVGFTINVLENTTGLTFTWADNGAGTINVNPNTSLEGYQPAWVLVNGPGGTERTEAQIFFKEVVAGKIVLECLDNGFALSNLGTTSGNIEVRYYKTK